MRQVIDEIITTTTKYFRGRKILIWGYESSLGKIIESVLQSKGMHVFGWIDSNSAYARKPKVFKPEVLNGKKEQYYVVIPLGRYKSILDILKEYDYIENHDYHYFCNCVISETDDYYEDSHGNVIIGYRDGAKFVTLGYHSKIIIGKGSEISGKITIGTDSNILIGDNTHFEANITIKNNASISCGDNTKFSSLTGVFACDNSIIQIGNKVVFRKCGLVRCDDYGKIVIGDNVIIGINANVKAERYASIELGKGCNIGIDFRCLAPPESILEIGEGCLFSWGCTVISHDAHPIFDVITQDCINDDKKDVYIGRHVWIGNNSVILPTSAIGNGSVVGAGAIVKGKYPNNCLMAGQIAKVIRKNIAWSRYAADSIDDIPKQYNKLTKNDS